MTRSPNHRRLSLILARRASLVLGVMALGGIATGAWWARNYIYNDLAPLVETNLEQLLGRSIKLGQVEGFTLSSLRFSSLSIPATPTDPDTVTAQAVDVQFSPWQILVTRTLVLDVTLVKPNVYIQLLALMF